MTSSRCNNILALINNKRYKVSGGYLLKVFHTVCLISILAISGGCSTHRANSRQGHSVRKHRKERVEKPHISTANLSSKRKAIVREAQSWMGTPYKYAESTKHKGADCSGLVLSVYLETTGIKLPRNSAQQKEFCKSLKEKDVLPGDLVFFATGKDPSRVSHVGIMLNDEDFIHMSTSKGAVISKTTTPYYTRTFMGYGRVPGM